MNYNYTEQSLKEAIERKKNKTPEDYSVLSLLTGGVSIEQLKEYKTDLYYKVLREL